ncbi:MAG: hypothetical protein J4F31_03460 [Flavobacteriales bacterium]|nr:hypothetical protein [Flavobacteriales bacterium]
MRYLLTLLAAAALSSCATVFGSRNNTLRFDETISPDVTVYIDQVEIGSPTNGKLKIPATVVQHSSVIQILDPDKGVILTDTLARKVSTAYFILDFTARAVSHSVDFMSGNIYRPHPRNFSLEP